MNVVLVYYMYSILVRVTTKF